MLVSINIKHINNINFPVYGLPRPEYIYFNDNILRYNDKIIDDRNLPQETLGARRARIPNKKKHKLSRAYLDLSAVIEATKHDFIDSKGLCFTYEKTIYNKVISHEINKVVDKEYYSRLYLRGIEQPIVINRPPPRGSFYAGILYFKNYPWKVYKYTEEKELSFRKKI